MQMINFFVRYSDAVIEQETPMTAASMFWLETLHDSHLDQSLSLPYDRFRLVGDHKSDRGILTAFDFGNALSYHFLTYASLNNINLQHLALTCYYVFLFKLTNGEKDLCIAMTTDNRHKDDLKSVVGLFENIIPLRCQLDPHRSFHELIEQVEKMMINSLKYSYYPLQRILAQHPNVSKPVFLDTSFVYQSTEDQNTEIGVLTDLSRLHMMPLSININENEVMSKFDFALTTQYNQTTNHLSCTINASLDLFSIRTINHIAQRFHSMLEQLFNTAEIQMNKSICELSLVLFDERLLIQSMNNTQLLFPSVTCIHHEFVFRAIEHSQKLAAELDDQSLTYSELLFYVQILAMNLLYTTSIVPGDVICQCVERSLSMVN